VRRAWPAAWDDPHNADPAFARARIRHEALPALEAAIGPGVAQALARTAGQLRSDAEALDELAASQAPLMRDQDGAWLAGALAAAHVAIRTRVLRMAAIEAGWPPGRPRRPAPSKCARCPGGPAGTAALGPPFRGESAPVLRCGKLTFAVNVRDER
jgi:hypothetical protein